MKNLNDAPVTGVLAKEDVIDIKKEYVATEGGFDTGAMVKPATKDNLVLTFDPVARALLSSSALNEADWFVGSDGEIKVKTASANFLPGVDDGSKCCVPVGSEELCQGEYILRPLCAMQCFAGIDEYIAGDMVRNSSFENNVLSNGVSRNEQRLSRLRRAYLFIMERHLVSGIPTATPGNQVRPFYGLANIMAGAQAINSSAGLIAGLEDAKCRLMALGVDMSRVRIGLHPLAIAGAMEALQGLDKLPVGVTVNQDGTFSYYGAQILPSRHVAVDEVNNTGYGYVWVDGVTGAKVWRGVDNPLVVTDETVSDGAYTANFANCFQKCTAAVNAGLVGTTDILQNILLTDLPLGSCSVGDAAFGLSKYLFPQTDIV